MAGASDIETPHGLARVLIQEADGDAPAALVLGHGAGGSVSAPDIQAATRVALELGLTIALVEQPYRVAGKKSPPRPPVLDAAWIAVLEALDFDMPVITGGRSAGARVACRTVAETNAIGVLCLAFPLMPPGKNPQSRQPELDAVDVPVLIVQGESDRFGMPESAGKRNVVKVRGDHGLKSDLQAVGDAVRAWLPTAIPQRRTS